MDCLAVGHTGPCPNKIENFHYLGESYFDDELYLTLSARNVNLTNSTAPRPEVHHLNAWTGDFQLYHTNIQLGSGRYVFRNKLLGELFLIFDFKNKNAKVYRNESTPFSNFLVGAHAWTWNFLLKDRISMAGGFNMTDFSLGATYVPSDSTTGEPRFNDRYTPEPNGWYLGFGPTLMTDFLLTDFLLLETQFDYTFNVVRIIPLSYGETVKGYPLPHAGFLSLNLMSSYGVTAGIDYSFLIDRGATDMKPRKFEVLIGYRIML